MQCPTVRSFPIVGIGLAVESGCLDSQVMRQKSSEHPFAYLQALLKIVSAAFRCGGGLDIQHAAPFTSPPLPALS